MIPLITIEELQDEKTREDLVKQGSIVQIIARRALAAGLMIGMGIGIITTFATCASIKSDPTGSDYTELVSK